VDTTPSAPNLMGREGLIRWFAYAGALTTLVTATGYVIGYMSVSYAAQRLHVSTRDLGLTVTDYLLLPMWSYLAVTLGILGFWVQLVMDDDSSNRKISEIRDSGCCMGLHSTGVAPYSSP